MDFRSRIIVKLYELFHFSLKGDAELGEAEAGCEISCVINFYGRTNLVRGVLSCLAAQDFGKERFEVVLIEDRNGTDKGKAISEEFMRALDIRYFTLAENFGIMGYARNYGLSKSRGEYILLLDDDTVILDQEFLSKLKAEFTSSGAGAVMPRGTASYCLIKGRYGFHDPYFPTNRCMAYRRETLRELGGFVSDIIGQEDVEFTVRLTASGKKLHRSENCVYMHPPLITKNTNKAAAVGLSFAKLRSRYPTLVWLLLLLNGVRDLPKLIFPINIRYKMQGKFSLGFIIGVWYSLTGRKIEYN